MTPTRPAVTACARPGCTNPVTRPRAPGRPPIYCSPACRQRAKQRRDDQPIHVEVDHTPLTTDRRPAGRVWLVRLRRGHRTVIVANGLGRTSADHLAEQITAVLHPQATTKGAAIN